MNSRLPPVLLMVAMLTACTVGPDYQRPSADLPAAFKEDIAWSPASPAAPEVVADWWQAYDDPTMASLVAQVAHSNLGLQAAEAAYQQALSAVTVARAAYYPTLSTDYAFSRAGTGSALANPSGSNGMQLQFTSTWELDLWGRVRRTVEAGTATATATADDYQAALLSAQGTAVQTYVQLRVTSAQKKLVDDTVVGLERSLAITRNQYKAGVASRLDVVQAETLLHSTQASASDLDLQRAQLEHALATLVGRAPADFQVEAGTKLPHLPSIPLTVPSTLLERRPDIAAAERRVAAANANIGVAQAAYYPTIGLSASAGFEGGSFVNLASLPYSFWSVAPMVTQSLFDGFLRKAQKRQAIAAFHASVANYRQTVLAAIQEVEDNLAALRLLGDELVTQEAAARAANEAQSLALNQYKAGTVSYLNVVTAQTAALNAANAALSVRGRQLLASAVLLKALGGGWPGTATP